MLLRILLNVLHCTVNFKQLDQCSEITEGKGKIYYIEGM